MVSVYKLDFDFLTNDENMVHISVVVLQLKYHRGVICVNEFIMGLWTRGKSIALLLAVKNLMNQTQLVINSGNCQGLDG